MSRVGYHRGRHVTGWIDEIKRLRREGHSEEALKLLSGCMEATIRESKAEGFPIASWYWEQAAITHRQAKDFDEEVAVLERYEAESATLGVDGSYLSRRLDKARELAEGARRAADAPPAACPSCGAVIDPPPKRSRTCPHCAERIVVRRQAGAPIYLTETQDSARKAESDRRRNETRVLKIVNELGVTDDQFADWREGLEERDPRMTEINDAFWILSQEHVVEAIGSGDLGRLSYLYDIQARHLVDRGRDWTLVASHGAAAYLRWIAGWKDHDAVVAVVGCRCAACGADDRDRTLAEVLAEPTIPHVDCKNPPCSCRLMDAAAKNFYSSGASG